jgi:REP element-mobilizing transposase RayT
MKEQAPDPFGRRSIRLKGYDYSQAGGYCITIVSFRREYLFGELLGGEMQVNALGRIVKDCWGEIPVHFPNVVLDAFVVMPNHVHGIIFIHDDNRATASSRRGTIYRAPTLPHRASTSAIEQFGKPTVGSLSTIIRTVKASVTRRAGGKLNSANLWQRNYYEHILRDQSDYERIAGYILDNPLNWAKDEEHPHNQGDDIFP